MYLCIVAGSCLPSHDLLLKCTLIPLGRRRASGEEGAAEQQPHGGSGCPRQGGRPQRPAAGSGGLVLHCWCHYRKDCLVEAACAGRQIGLMDLPHHGI